MRTAYVLSTTTRRVSSHVGVERLMEREICWGFVGGELAIEVDELKDHIFEVRTRESIHGRDRFVLSSQPMKNTIDLFLFEKGAPVEFSWLQRNFIS